MDIPAKRTLPSDDDVAESGSLRSPTPRTLTHPISPPLKKRRLPGKGEVQRGEQREGQREVQSPEGKEMRHVNGKDVSSEKAEANAEEEGEEEGGGGEGGSNVKPRRLRFRSPFRLTAIRDLPPELNRDAVTLEALLGDPLIAECWEFNYLHDIGFLMGKFDEDVRDLVRVHVVHGFWKKDDERRLALEVDAAQHKNVVLHSAYLPEMFGTHHSKMMILVRHDDTAQVIIHTANMIARDWTNMTQAAWISPLLPLLPQPQQQRQQQIVPPSQDEDQQQQRQQRHHPKIGSGEKFKVDLLNYLRAYDGRRQNSCKPLVEQLARHDFSAVRGALIASIPGRHPVHSPSPTRWGWAAMKQTLTAVPARHDDGENNNKNKPEIAVQVSSIATLGPTDAWLRTTFFGALSGSRNSTRNATSTSTSKPKSKSKPEPEFKSEFKVVFPTPDEIRRSLDGYASGGSIHTKTQSAQQAKQLRYLRPIFCHWGNDSEGGKELHPDATVNEAGRKRAAPHIKTYIRYGNGSHETIDWALLTSANLSKQAWGEAATMTGEMRIASYEIGVLVWPELFADDAVMTGTFLRDDVVDEEYDGDEGKPVVALRMPYNLPLQGYGEREEPWVATKSYAEPDWMGRVWSHE